MMKIIDERETQIKKKNKGDRKTECIIHIKNLKQARNHGLVLEKVHRAI